MRQESLIRLVGWPVLAWRRRELARFRRSLQDVARIQAERLATHLAALEGSAFANDFGLAGVRTVGALRERLPLAGFERAAPYVDRVMRGETAALFAPRTRVVMLATTSGTTASIKHIPVTAASLAEYRQSWTVWGCALAERHPRLPFGGVVNLASDWRVRETEAGIPCGSITGLLYETMHKTLRLNNAITPETFRERDTDRRYFEMLRQSLARRDVRTITAANPSTLLVFARKMDELREELLRALATAGRKARVRELEATIDRHGALHPAGAWPELTLLGVWTGGTLGSYLSLLPRYYGAATLRDHGLSASEGRMTLPLDPSWDGGVLNVAAAHYELVPAAEYEAGDYTGARLAHELDVGGRYVVAITTSGGLVRYDMSDVVECTGKVGDAPILKFLNKSSQFANLTGEKLSAHQVSGAIRGAQESLGIYLGECALTPVFGDPPQYHLLLERSAMPSSDGAALLARRLDDELCARNVEYAEKRRSGRLGAVQLGVVPDGAFETLRQQRLLARGAAFEQYKHPFLIPDAAEASLLGFVPRQEERAG